MKQLLPIGLLLGAWLGLQPITVLHAETLYVNSDNVPVTQSDTPTAKVVTTLNKGSAVTLIKKKDRYRYVKLANGTKGWIYQYKLTNTLPASGQSGVNLGLLSGNSSIHAKEARSGGSIRGMQPVSKEYAQNKRIDGAHIRALEWMERFQVSDNELIRFKREGKIGEFLGGGS